MKKPNDVMRIMGHWGSVEGLEMYKRPRENSDGSMSVLRMIDKDSGDIFLISCIAEKPSPRIRSGFNMVNYANNLLKGMGGSHES